MFHEWLWDHILPIRNLMVTKNVLVESHISFVASLCWVRSSTLKLLLSVCSSAMLMLWSASNFATIHWELSAALNLRFRKSGDGWAGLIYGAYTKLEGLHWWQRSVWALAHSLSRQLCLKAKYKTLGLTMTWVFFFLCVFQSLSPLTALYNKDK